MKNIEEKYKNIFIEVFDLDTQNVENLTKNDIESWDSVSIMLFIAEIEKEFSIKIQPNDIFLIDSYQSGLKILTNYLNN